jgi:opacity protein-like surface antigen
MASRISAGVSLLALGFSLCMGSGARAEGYFAFFSGTSGTKNSDVHVTQPSSNTDAVFHDVSWEARPYRSPIYYGIKIGGFSKNQPHWGAELDATHYKVYARTQESVPVSGTWNGSPIGGDQVMNNFVQHFAISHGVNTIAFNLLYRWMIHPSDSYPHGRIQPYLGGGPAYYILHEENTINNAHVHEKYKPSEVGWQAVAGVRYGVSRKFSLLLEEKYSSAEAKVDTAGGGWATTRLNTWQTAAGVQINY